jgi:hypothetical protein
MVQLLLAVPAISYCKVLVESVSLFENVTNDVSYLL